MTGTKTLLLVAAWMALPQATAWGQFGDPFGPFEGDSPFGGPAPPPVVAPPAVADKPGREDENPAVASVPLISASPGPRSPTRGKSAS